MSKVQDSRERDNVTELKQSDIFKSFTIIIQLRLTNVDKARQMFRMVPART